LTWEWRNGLRGYIYPTVFAVIYKLLGILRMDSRTLVVCMPHDFELQLMLTFHSAKLCLEIIIIIITAIRLTWYKCKSTARPRYNTWG